jgi:ferredoxin
MRLMPKISAGADPESCRNGAALDAEQGETLSRVLRANDVHVETACEGSPSIVSPAAISPVAR